MRTVLRPLLPNGFVLAGAVVPTASPLLKRGNVRAPDTGPGVLRPMSLAPALIPRLIPQRLPWPPAPPIDRGGRY